MIRSALITALLTTWCFALDPIEQGPTEIKDSIPVQAQDTTTLSNAGGFSFKAYSIDLHTALALFAQSAGLTLRTEVPLTGNRNIEFRDQDLKSAIESILAPDTTSWKIENNTLVIGEKAEPTIKAKFKGLEVEGDNFYRMFTIDYPRTARKSNTSIEGSVNGLNGKAAAVSITSADETNFWQEVKETIEALLSEEGKYSINYISGVIFVQDITNNLNTIQLYLEKVVPILTRQVKITARLYEVTLNDDQSMGINWNFTTGSDIAGLNAGSNVITSNNYSDGYKANTVTANLGFDYNIDAIITMLSEQGDVRSVSQPRIITMHNQPAIVKVGTLYPYFTAQVEQDPETGIRTVTETVETISLGTWLSITPQISKDSNITLLIDPVLSDLTGTVTSRIGATAPIVDIKQSSSILRVKDRETVRISGLQQTKDQQIQRGVPYLSEIPYLGGLFRWKYETKVRKELVIFITTEVID